MTTHRELNHLSANRNTESGKASLAWPPGLPFLHKPTTSIRGITGSLATAAIARITMVLMIMLVTARHREEQRMSSPTKRPATDLLRSKGS